MESTIVNARIPVAKRNAAKPILDSLGKTPSDLINSAYNYLLNCNKLPTTELEIKDDKKSFKDFQKFYDETTEKINWGDDAAKSDKELLVDALEKKYGPIT